MFSWLYFLIRKYDKMRQKDKEVWHYECINAHKWESMQSPRGTFCFGELGQTKCPVCGTPICKGTVFINGKITSMGAVHVGFIKKRKRK